MTNYEKLLAKLIEMFQLDQADLDFGIYRIMNSKRDEIVRFLEHDLLPQVKQVLLGVQSEIGATGAEELQTLETQVRAAGMNPDDSPKVRELRAKYAGSGDIGALEQEVFNHLYSFFRRYYYEGDFMSLRRYKEGVYAVPYEGEEVKLHWANADQYYIKTAEHFRDFIFKVGEHRVHFKLVDAHTERDNNKEQEKRVFILSEEDPVVDENGELIIRFEYRNDSAKRKQKVLTEAAIATILNGVSADWKTILTAKAPTDKEPNRTILAKRLNDYTARNTFDYFIHKDLGGFLRRELDFYIKNEVMHLDDIENEAAPKVEQYLAKIRALRRVASKIIDFLAQLEDFQKSLWLKKKFVVDTQYLVTLDLVPKELHPEIAANEAQRNEWVRLFRIDEIKGDLATAAYSVPLSIEFLAGNPYLSVDSALFPLEFRQKLLCAIQRHEGDCDGIVIQSDNLQALRLIHSRYRQSVNFVYADPPYNTGGGDFAYKDSFQHSSWISMFRNSLAACSQLIAQDSVLFFHIDNHEQTHLRLIAESVLGERAFQSMIAWKNKYGPGAATSGIGDLHEHIIVLSPNPKISLSAPLDEHAISQYSGRDSKFNTRGGYVTQPLATKSKDPRPNLVYPVIYGSDEIFPDKQWIWAKERMEAAIANDEVIFNKQSDGSYSVRFKQYLKDENGMMRRGKPLSFIIGPFNQDGSKEIEQLFGARVFAFPKPSALGQKLLNISADSWQSAPLVMDYFAGSGTVAQAVINQNREDKQERRFILIEGGAHFNTVVKPRIAKVVYSNSWQDGKPLNRNSGVRQFVKFLKLESYEDCLANLVVQKLNVVQTALVESNSKVREDYMLHYILRAETADSPSTLNVQSFDHPFEYKLKIAADTVGETKEVNVDMVETFNWLLGLRVHTLDVIRGFHIVTGRLPGQGNSENGDKALIIWRDITENPNEKLDEFFAKQAFNTLDQEFDVIYVNGDNNLQNLRKDDQTWKVRLIEEEFHRLMWDVEDI